MPESRDDLDYASILGDKGTANLKDWVAKGGVLIGIGNANRYLAAQNSGRGFVIGFTQDPNVRAYLDGLNVIFMNAIFRGSAHARPVR